MEMVLPRIHEEIEQDEMMYLDGGFYVSNSQLKGILIAVGMNPMGAVSAAVLAAGIKRAGTAIGTRIGLIGGPVGAAFGTIIGFAVSGWAASTIAHALIQGKGVDVGLMYTSGGIPYGVKFAVK
ncbi:hypothetical protein bcere0016_10290 [Bacillus cereus 95/8201]|uniref:Uncharacterized protein n=1 Tax=Bacillus cereus (strain AH820) TaxID=405535 RepID=B7JDP8_BACC0|nr:MULTISPECIES: hypothetical protein [Bacillus]CUB55605.1 hypothetical protein BN2127_JRS10_03320 [Bacillus subtilis]ACK90708.1 conserved hypothetical protein [Bacillus cereus AH820]AJH64804.1 hypothetical protein BG11_2595 [Bacillus cereus]AJK32626.1 hypothetical protein BF33_3183 [Bacillus cereus]EEL18322.1 hypothetical protein bcere0016_10290 [Bacillus cereus 95/8201]